MSETTTHWEIRDGRLKYDRYETRAKARKQIEIVKMERPNARIVQVQTTRTVVEEGQ